MRKLTAKQTEFCRQVAMGKSLVEAYKIAYATKRMKESTIKSEASKLAKHPNITTTIDDFKKKYSKAATDKGLLEAEEIISTYAKIIRANVGDFFTPIGEDKKGNPIYAAKNFSEIDSSAVKKVKMSNDGKLYGIELYDKNAALSKLADIFGLAETVRAEGDGIRIEMTDDFGDIAE